LQRFRRGQALELLPVTGLGEDRLHRLARLSADLEPVLDPVGVDLDQRGLLLRVVDPDVLDRPAVALGARVRDDDAVLRVADLSHPQKPDTYGHCVLAPGFVVVVVILADHTRWGTRERQPGGLATCPGLEGAGHAPDTSRPLCQTRPRERRGPLLTLYAV